MNSEKCRSVCLVGDNLDYVLFKVTLVLVAKPFSNGGFSVGNRGSFKGPKSVVHISEAP